MPHDIPYAFTRLSDDEQYNRSAGFLSLLRARRSVREFSDAPVRRDVIENIIRTAGTAPSGANKQPWRFVIVTDPALKHEIRVAAEKEENENYGHRMSEEWLRDLAPIGTDWHKEFLDVAPVLIVIFSLSYDRDEGTVRKNYYVRESVGIAAGFLLTAIHNAGLAALTHTPSPMEFLGTILGRPENEKPFMLIPVGYPKEGATVPDIHRKRLEEICIWK
jgi:iodotyrosine deiodinase